MAPTSHQMKMDGERTDDTPSIQRKNFRPFATPFCVGTLKISWNRGKLPARIKTDETILNRLSISFFTLRFFILAHSLTLMPNFPYALIFYITLFFWCNIIIISLFYLIDEWFTRWLLKWIWSRHKLFWLTHIWESCFFIIWLLITSPPVIKHYSMILALYRLSAKISEVSIKI